MTAKSSMSLRYILTLTTFSQDDPAASKTSPRLEMHCAYSYVNSCIVNLRTKRISKTHGMFFDPTVNDLSRFVGRDLTAQKYETRHFRAMG